MIAVDVGTITVAGIMSLANLGGFAFMAKRYAASVDKHNEVIPVMVKTLETVNSAQEKTTAHLTELYESRSDLRERMVKVETTHERNGCNLPIQKGGQ
jgi:hypothetical protein